MTFQPNMYSRYRKALPTKSLDDRIASKVIKWIDEGEHDVKIHAIEYGHAATEGRLIVIYRTDDGLIGKEKIFYQYKDLSIAKQFKDFLTVVAPVELVTELYVKSRERIGILDCLKGLKVTAVVTRIPGYKIEIVSNNQYVLRHAGTGETIDEIFESQAEAREYVSDNELVISRLATTFKVNPDNADYNVKLLRHTLEAIESSQV